MKKTNKIKVCLLCDPDQMERVKQLKWELHISQGEIMRLALEQFLLVHEASRASQELCLQKEVSP